MKLKASQYQSPLDREGVFEEVLIEDTSHNIDYEFNTFTIRFKMYYLKNEKKIILDENQITFRGSNSDLVAGLPTTNRTTYLKVYNQDYDPEIPQYIEIPNPDYMPEHEGSDEEGNAITIPANSETISVENPDYIPESYNISMLKYMYAHEGQMPEVYDVIDYGMATQQDAIGYFTGGELASPKLFLPSVFARQWLLNNLQMKGRYITDFEFVE